VAVLNDWAHQESATNYKALPSERQAALRDRLTSTIRTNTYDAATSRVTISAERAAFAANAEYYDDVFRNGRDEYAIPPGTLTDPTRARQLAAFFSWSAWAASANLDPAYAPARV